MRIVDIENFTAQPRRPVEFLNRTFYVPEGYSWLAIEGWDGAVVAYRSKPVIHSERPEWLNQGIVLGYVNFEFQEEETEQDLRDYILKHLKEIK